MNLNFFAGVEYKNKIYFSAFYVNGLFVFDLKREEITFLKLFEKEKMKKRLHRAAFIHNNEAWFIPQEAENIACVNLDTLDITYYKPPYTRTNIDYETSTEYHLYLSGRVVDDRYLYLVPADIDTVSVIDMEMHNISSVYIIDDIEKERYNDLIVIDSKLWMIPRIGTGLKVLDLDTKKIVEKKWGYDDYSYSSVEVVNGKLWFAPCVARNVLSIDLDTEEHKLFTFEPATNKYSGMFKVGNILFICPIEGENFIVIDSKKLKIATEVYSKYKYIFTKNPNKMSIICSGERKMITTGGTNSVVEFSDEGIVRVLSIGSKISNMYELRTTIEHKEFIRDAIINCTEESDEIVGLEGYLSYIDRIRIEGSAPDNDVGIRIWENVC